MVIFIKEGDIFALEGIHSYAHGCNCLGGMDAGIAVEFRRRYPGMYAQYKALCAEGRFQPGDVFDYPAGAGHVYNLATQYSWKPEARLDYIAASLQRMCELATADGVGQIALPAIGAGLGGLDWKEVRLIVEQVGEKYPEIHLYVVEHYSPGQGFPGRRS